MLAPALARLRIASVALLAALAALAPHAHAWEIGGPAYGHSLARVWANSSGVDVAWLLHGGGTQTYPWLRSTHSALAGVNATAIGDYGFGQSALDVCPAAPGALFVAALTTTDSLGVHVSRVPAQAPFPAAGRRVSSGYTGSGGVLSIRCAPLADGGCVVIWTRTVPSGTWVNRITATGAIAPGWTVAGRKLGSLPWPDGIAVCDDGAGGFYAMFYDSDLGLYVTRYDAAGTRVTNFPALLSSGALQNASLPGLQPAVANRALTAWIESATLDTYNDGTFVIGRVTATGGFFQPAYLNVTGAGEPRLVPDGADGGYLVWAHSPDGGVHADLRAVLVRAGGTLAPGWPDTGLVITPADAVVSPAVTSNVVTTGGLREWNFEAGADSAGGLLVAWTDLRDGAGSPAVYLAARTSAGTPRAGTGAARRISPPGTPGSVVGVGAWSHLAPGPVAYVAWDRVTGSPFPGLTDALELTALDVTSGNTLATPAPAASALVLRAPWPNPASGALTLRFALPADERATLELFDVSGRRVAAREASGAGEHVARFDETRTLPPGLYLVRLAQAEEKRVARITIAH